MLQNFGALLVGIIVGSVANIALISLNGLVLFPPPEGTDLTDPAQLRAYMSALPTAAYLVAMAAHLAQAFLGGWVAARLSATTPVVVAGIVGVLTLAGTVWNFFDLGAPLWTAIEFPLDVLVALGAGEIERRRRGA